VKKKYFGTDGIRGRVGKLPITPEFFVKLGYAAGVVLSRRKKKKSKAISCHWQGYAYFRLYA